MKPSETLAFGDTVRRRSWGAAVIMVIEPRIPRYDGSHGWFSGLLLGEQPYFSTVPLKSAYGEIANYRREDCERVE